MPDTEKKKQDDENEPQEGVVSENAANEESGSDVPPVTEDAEKEVAADSDSPEDGSDGSKDAPPDLVPDEEPEDESDVTDTETEETPFDDEKTDKAIDEITAKESDDILAVQDAAAAKGSVKPARKGAFSRFWHNKWVRSITLLLLFGGLAAAMAVPSSRYWALNTAGVRSSSSVVVVDSTTRLPLKGVDVSVGGQKVKTDSDGEAAFTGLELGPANLVITRVGFEEVKRDIVIGWGSNPLGTFALKATGVQYVIEVRDYLSDKPIEGVEATDGQATAVSGKDGKITLTLDTTVVAQNGVTLSKAGYRSDAITLDEDPKKPTRAALVIARKAVFVSRQNGKYDVYKSDIDGQNREVLLAATGNENSNISLVTSSDGTRAAFVSTRNNKRDSGGFLLSSLMLINVETGSTLTIAESAQVQLIDWSGTRLVFQLGSSDSGAEDRYTVASYDYGNNTRVQLAAAKKLPAVISAKGFVYYAVGADPSDPSLQLGLFKVGLDGKGKQRVFDDELVTVLRSTYGGLSLQSIEGTWYTYDLTSGAKTQTSTPSSLASRLYVDNGDRTRSLWSGQGTLRLYDVAANKDTDVATKSGLTYPLQWAGASAVIYRVSSGSETADYAVSLDGGTPRKVADVTPTYGFSQAQ